MNNFIFLSCYKAELFYFDQDDTIYSLWSYLNLLALELRRRRFAQASESAFEHPKPILFIWAILFNFWCRPQIFYDLVSQLESLMDSID